MQYPHEDILTDMPYTIYGEGIYRAIESVSVLDVPIIITENGVADAADDRRALYIKRYLYSVSKAIEDLPEPETPVKTVRRFLCRLRSTFFRLWTDTFLSSIKSSVIIGHFFTGNHSKNFKFY